MHKYKYIFFYAESQLCPETFYPQNMDSIDELSTPYKLRPEVLESVFYLFRLTGEEKYRQFGWKLIQVRILLKENRRTL